MDTYLLGYAAATLTTISFLPQAFKTLKSRSAADFSAFTLVIFTSGMVAWAVYGALIGDGPVVVCNVILLVCMMPIIYVKIGNWLQRS